MERDRSISYMRFGRLFAILTAAFVLMVAPAFGQTVQQEGYEDEAAQVQEQVAGAGVGAGAADEGEGSALPFTGLDFGLMVGAAGGLFVVGLAMRRLTRAPQSP
jgi:hypothetical protein